MEGAVSVDDVFRDGRVDGEPLVSVWRRCLLGRDRKE
jgi:hypothetical protein